ncbi:copper homeostasis periplasmic binding protein CopC [Sphingomonas sp. SRS2]|uniref:copper homeostasis periplasmic binding protein CopC n=1 Tax=Sphingomonas sp. SRS2 TaxID=133190 RepID=UPI0006184C2C|nr:copper homeostasis periplasmic binding protein CopC [Sphingomonas sp. SRS2]KKC24777.1 copper resistance protein CopC [Sphingomonas sp. SRS2]
MRHLYPVAASALIAMAFAGTSAMAAAPKLVSATPAANAKVSNLTVLSLTFSEAVSDKASGAEVIMTGMPGMAHHGPMKMSGSKTALSANRKTMSITFPRALVAGTYEVKWHAVAADKRKAAGGYSFSVK